ncbi:hypothetical protein B0T25DRAFT_581072 [Lasiosphaeria hispida]|uniref:Actin-like ATPase domain-containing protein n=1 Tax=Lasiosphaeria hispida TaxID=260671 RepID=A0AAJ0HJ30_9PEZI|nr:hypothetical protein B0T25DRAFT_581072 [Lasiosphaeria hispida]
MDTMAARTRDFTIGLDFGTTHTGISYGFSLDQDVFSVEQWPNLDKTLTKAQKTPTLIAYQPSGATAVWGYEAKEESRGKLCGWMKFHLDRRCPFTEHDDSRLATALWPDGLFRCKVGKKTPEQITTDYLKKVFEFTMKNLHESTENLIYITKIRWWIATPANWSGQARTRLQLAVEAAAKAARMSRDDDEFNFVTEADATMFSLLEMANISSSPKPPIKDGDTVLVCDCGAGTVDVAVYEVVSASSPAELREVVAGRGGKCGSSCINLSFDQFMADRFGEAYDKVAPKKKRMESEFMKEFECHMQKFDTHEDPYRFVDPSLPLCMQDVSEAIVDQGQYTDGFVILTSKDMEKIFRDTITKVIELISKQHDAATKGTKAKRITRLMLAGGFSQFPYLQRQVRKWCRARGIEIIIDPNSWGAVSRGAVLRGLERMNVSTHLSRLHCGILCHQPFDEKLDAGRERHKDPAGGRDLVANTVKWYTRRGADISKHVNRTKKFSKDLNETKREITVRIVSCKLDTAPRHSEDPGVELVAELRVVPSNPQWERCRAEAAKSKRSTVRFTFRIEETVGSTQGSLVYRAVTTDGTPIGQTEIELPKLD